MLHFDHAFCNEQIYLASLCWVKEKNERLNEDKIHGLEHQYAHSQFHVDPTFSGFID